MLALLDQTSEPFVADEAEAVMAKKAMGRLDAVARANQSVTIAVEDGGQERIFVPLPARAVQFIHAVLEAMANRTPVSLIPHDAELSTQQAADYLNVSRPYLVQQIEDGKLPHRKVGRHRRVRFADLIDYEKKTKADQRRAVEELQAQAQRLGLE